MSKKFGCILSGKLPKEFRDCCWSSTVEEGLPVLYIGYDRASENIDCFDVTKKKYDGDVWWCFGKMERRNDYLATVSAFKAHAVRKAMEKVRYEYVDFTCYDLNRIKAFIKYMRGGDRKVCFLTKGSEFVFIYSEKYSTVWGLSLSLCEYVGIAKEKVVRRLRKNRRNIFVHGTSYIDEELRKIVGYDTHYIPVLHTYFNDDMKKE